MFKFENNMPYYWENESRDFQLLTRVDEILYMGQRADIATITNLNSNKKCKNTFLNLLAKKVGFFTNEYIEDNVLRNIIGAFRLAVKYKGTVQGILIAVTAILKAENTTDLPYILINKENYDIEIYTPIDIVNKVALREFLKYVTPTGFTTSIYAYTGAPIQSTTELNIDNNRLITANLKALDMNAVRGSSGIIGLIDIDNIDKDKLLETLPNSEIEIPTQNTADDYYKNYLRDLYSGSVGMGMVVDNIREDEGEGQ